MMSFPSNVEVLSAEDAAARVALMAPPDGIPATTISLGKQRTGETEPRRILFIDDSVAGEVFEEGIAPNPTPQRSDDNAFSPNLRDDFGTGTREDRTFEQHFMTLLPVLRGYVKVDGRLTHALEGEASAQMSAEGTNHDGAEWQQNEAQLINDDWLPEDEGNEREIVAPPEALSPQQAMLAEAIARAKATDFTEDNQVELRKRIDEELLKGFDESAGDLTRLDDAWEDIKASLPKQASDWSKKQRVDEWFANAEEDYPPLVTMLAEAEASSDEPEAASSVAPEDESSDDDQAQSDERRLAEIESELLIPISRERAKQLHWRVQFNNGGSRLLESKKYGKEHREWIGQLALRQATIANRAEMYAQAGHTGLLTWLQETARQQLDMEKAAEAAKVNRRHLRVA